MPSHQIISWNARPNVLIRFSKRSSPLTDLFHRYPDIYVMMPASMELARIGLHKKRRQDTGQAKDALPVRHSNTPYHLHPRRTRHMSFLPATGYEASRLGLYLMSGPISNARETNVGAFGEIRGKQPEGRKSWWTSLWGISLRMASEAYVSLHKFSNNLPLYHGLRARNSASGWRIKPKFKSSRSNVPTQ